MDDIKAYLRGKFIALGVYIKKVQKVHTNDLTTHMKTLEQKEANSPWRSRQQEIIKLRTEINKIETKRTIQRINETKSWFLEKIIKIDKSLSKIIKRQSENMQIYKIRMKGRHWEIKETDTEKIERIVRSHFKILYSTKLKKLKKWTVFSIDTTYQN